MEYKFQATAFKALQEAAEAYSIRFLKDCLLSAIHAKQVTVIIC